MDVDMLSHKQERQLVGAMKSAIADVASGVDPNKAIAKHASDNNFGPELAARMVEAFNTSKTLNYLKNSEGEKRADSFSLADVNEVYKNMYTPEKKAGVVRYNDPARINFNDRTPRFADPGVEKAAAAMATKPIKTAMYAQPSKVKRDAAGFLKEISNARDELRAHSKHARHKVVKMAHEIAQHFRVPMWSGREFDFETVEKRACYTFGDTAKQALDIVWDMIPEKLRTNEKRAETIPNTHVVMPDHGFLGMVREYVGAIKEAADAHAAYIGFDKKASLVEDHFRGQLDKLANRKEKEVPFSLLSKEAKKDKDKKKKESKPDYSGALQDVRPDAVAKNLIGPPQKPLRSDPALTAEHEGSIRAIRAKAMLNDLIANSPEVSGYPVEDVFETFNMLSESFPALSTNPLMMKQLVSSSLARGGKFDPMELKTLLGTEEAQRLLRVKGT